MVQEAKGTFRKTKAGSVEYRFPYYDEFGKRRVKSVTAKDEDACLDKAEDFIAQLKDLQRGINYGATIPEIMRKKVEQDYKKNYCGIQGYDRNLGTIKIIERSVLGNIPIAKITENMMEHFLEGITTYSNGVISKVYSMITVAFRIAYSKGIIKDNFMLNRDFRCPKSRKKDKKVRGLTEEEQRRFLKALDEHKVPYGSNSYKNQLLIELYSGLRMGEINALKPSDIDLRKGVIHVSRTISRGMNSAEFVKEGTKTEAGFRDVPISNKLRPVLEKSLKEVKDNPEGLVFYDYHKHGLISTSQVNAYYRRLCEKAEIPYTGQHSLRHTFATRCIEAGIHALVLKNWLGHSDIHMTLDIYADVFSRMNLDAIRQLETHLDMVEDELDEKGAYRNAESVIYLHNDRVSKVREPMAKYAGL